MSASLDTDRVNEEGDSISRIRLFPLYLLNQLTFHHFCMCMGHALACRELKVEVIGQGQCNKLLLLLLLLLNEEIKVA